MDEIITLYDESDKPHDFRLLATFGADDNDYIAIIPVLEISDEVIFFRMEHINTGEVNFCVIEDDEEFKLVVEVFEELRKESLQ